ncbi:hypothetical protein EDC04DRAFT_3092301 [Pisolithus marmoratus]|nr:hypothetical protein EDC04DRAFT_3092301 [Pisolithus marmoratus]
MSIYNHHRHIYRILRHWLHISSRGLKQCSMLNYIELTTAADVEWFGRPIWNNRTKVRVAIGHAVQKCHPHTHFLLPTEAFENGARQLNAAGLRAGDSIEIGRYKGELPSTRCHLHTGKVHWWHGISQIQGLPPHAVQATDQHNVQGITITLWLSQDASPQSTCTTTEGGCDRGHEDGVTVSIKFHPAVRIDGDTNNGDEQDEHRGRENDEKTYESPADK